MAEGPVASVDDSTRRTDGQAVLDVSEAAPEQWYVTTVCGDLPAEDIHLVLPHEHICTDDRAPTHRDYLDLDWLHVAQQTSDVLSSLKGAGVSLMVDWTAIGLGRNAFFLRDVSRRSGMPIACATGIGNGAIPPSLSRASVDRLAEEFVSEITLGVDHASIRATFIKVTSLDGGPTSDERRVLVAAGIAASETGAALGIHALDAAAFRDALQLVERDTLDLRQVIWSHAEFSSQAEHLEAAARGVCLQFDGVSVSRPAPYAIHEPEETLLNQIAALVEAGYERQVLVSNDAAIVRAPDVRYCGDPHILLERFVPLMVKRFGTAVVDVITRENPIRMFGRRVSPRSRQKLPHEAL
jgi:predicted metal-dependent phosphotriesterase family hydrolase